MPRRVALVLTLVSTFVCLATKPRPAAAQSPGDPPLEGPAAPAPPAVVARDADGRVTLRATQLAGTPLTFDGRLDEAFYRSIPAISDFVQQEPDEGQPATERTEVWVLYDEENLYVSVRLWESEPERRIAPDMRRDANTLYTNDHFGVAFDSFYDRRNGYGFAVNPQGALLDWSITNEQPNNSWNGIWDARTADFEGGWSLEIRFPFRSFRFREGGTIWGINFRRAVRAKNEISFLTPVLASWGRGALSKLSIAAAVTGLEAPTRLRNIDVKPYVLGSMLTDRTARPAYANDPNGDIGVDVKWGIRQTLVADFTVNTDFAQVEDDEAQVNLTRFSLLFPEKRDFFLEGADVFTFAQSGPGGGGGGGGVQGGGQNTSTTPLLFYSRRIGLDNGVEVPIRAGGRLLGRTGPWRYGALNIQTAESDRAGSPTTNFAVGRVNYDFLARSRVGAMVTARTPLGDAPSGEIPADDDATNLGYGLDAIVNPTQEITILGYVAQTRMLSDAPVHDRSRRDNVSYRGRFDWNNDRYGLQAEHLTVAANFNPEVGYLRRTAFRRSYGQSRFSPRPAWRGVRKLFYEASVDYITDMNNRPESKELQASYRMELDNSDTWGVDVTRNFERLVNRFEVGRALFAPVGEYEFTQLRASYTFGFQRPVSGTLTAARGGFYDGTLTELTWRGRADLSPALYVEPTVSWNHVEVPAGSADTNLVSTRVTYSLSTRMFVSALVQYQSRSRGMATNARLRWEYQPGSELFVVYSDGRTTEGTGFPDVMNRSIVMKATRLLRW
jgi:hypothetical protein